MVVIRPFAAADAEPIDELLRTLWGHDPTMLAQYRWHRDWPTGAGRLRRTLVAAVDGGLVGAGTLFESAIHPRRPFVIVNVAVEWQRRGIGAALFNALEGLGDGRPWLAKTTRRDLAGRAFLAKRGFRPIVGTLTGLLDPRDDAVRAWLAGLPAAAPPFRLLRFDDPGCATSLAEVALVLAAVYRQFHGWNPPVEEALSARPISSTSAWPAPTGRAPTRSRRP